MKKQGTALLLVLAMLLLQLTALTESAPQAQAFSLTVNASDLPQAVFAREKIEAAAAKAGLTADWTVELKNIDEGLGYETYRIDVADHTVAVTGGDANGLMYGGLEVAEQLALYGAEGIRPCSASPWVKQRGMLCPVPMDMRSPSYNTPGDAGQKNIGSVWEMSFWEEYLDNLARNRMNIVQVWTVNSFASMVKVEGYEDVALDDVWRTKVPLDNSFRGDLTNAVRPEDWENYEVVKEMTIDEKIEFWRQVMAYARDRGIHFIFLFRHAYAFAEQGKHGIEADPQNAALQDYLGKSARALIETYPDLYGLGLNPGENMGWDNSNAGYNAIYQWLSDVYTEKVNEALAATPDRDFQVMINGNNKQSIADMFRDLRCRLTFVRQYTGVHMYATSTPHEGDAYVTDMPEGTGLWLNFRNEDCFDLRWGDPGFMTAFVKNMPADKVEGCVTGSDGYFYGYDYSSTDPDFSGQMYMKKHWYNYMLLGRLMYQKDLPETRIQEIFSAHYENRDGTDALYRITAEAGKIIPQVHQIYYQDNGDYTWFVAGCWSHPNTFGYIDVKRWMKSVNTFKEGNAMSIEEYALRIATGDDSEYTTDTPQEIADRLTAWGTDVLMAVEELRKTAPASNNPTFAEKEFWALAADDEAMAYLGLFYAEKILGSVDLRVYNETEDTAWKDSSVEHLKKSAEYFEKYAANVSERYVPQQLSRVGYFNVLNILKDVQNDVRIAEKWRPRKINPSWNAPSKTEYFGG